MPREPHDYGKADFKLLSAKFGAGDCWADVVEKVAPRIPNPFVPFAWGYKELPDPCYGFPKNLVVNFMYRGAEFTTAIPESEVANYGWACLLPEAATDYYASIIPQMFVPILELPEAHSVEQLQEAVARSGLSNYSNNYPTSLHPFLGKGLNIWQYPVQFAPYLAIALSLKPKSYLEIGTRFGGTFAFTTEYLREFGVLEHAIGVDLLDSHFMRGYAAVAPHVRFAMGDSHDGKTVGQERFDLVLLDGSHYEDGVREDFEMYSPGAKAVAIHDICDQGFDNGVTRFWETLKKERAGEFEFHEFVAQYPDVTQYFWGKTFFGIGLAVRKSDG
jgi:SAM-dependent methyltransferase